jgi:hypothetical protein
LRKKGCDVRLWAASNDPYDRRGRVYETKVRDEPEELALGVWLVKFIEAID